jgi:hypothetical protein
MDNNTYKCEFCDNMFVNSNSLKNHQRITKYCLEKQNKKFVCEHCNQLSYSNKDYEYHKNTCIEIFKIKIKDLEKQNKKLQEENIELKEKNKDGLFYQNQIQFFQDEIQFYKKQIISKDEYLQEFLNLKTFPDKNVKTCFEKKCNITPSYNIKGGQPLYCVTHKKENMVDVKSRKCYHEGCNTQPYYNIEGNTQGLYCVLHKKEGMIDVKNKKCKTYMCPTQVSEKYDGYCLFCYVNLFPDKPVSRNYKTKEYAVVEFVKQQYPNLSWISDKKIEDGCSRRRPDLLLDLGYQVIIVEIDENQHINYDCSCENKRLMELSQDLHHKPIIFIRFNPDEYKKNDELISSCWGTNKKGICVIRKKEEWENRLETLNEQIKYWVNPENKTDKTIEIIQLFYDTDF